MAAAVVPFPAGAAVDRLSAAATPDPRWGAGPSVATAPVNWNNSDVPGWANELPFSALLDEMAAAGYAATEYGGNFPPDPAALEAGLAARGMALCGAYHSLPFHIDGMLDEQGAGLERLLVLLAAVGCRDLIVAFPLTPTRIAVAGRVPSDGATGMTEAQWSAAARNLSAVGERALAHGMRAHFHNHVGSFVETPAEIERLLEVLEPDLVDLCYDCGHHAFGGGDPLAFVNRHHDRIGYLHLKDVDPVVLARARERSLGFVGALREYVFCELGQGMVDVPLVTRTLIENGYRGWVVVEQDTTPRHPTESARANRAFLRDCCGL